MEKGIAKKIILFLLPLIGILMLSFVVALTSFNSPTVCSGSWTNCINAFGDNVNRATAAASGSTNVTGAWTNYSLNIPQGAAVNSVILRADFFASKSSGFIDVRVSSNGGASYGPAHVVGGNTAEQTYLINATNDSSWTANGLNSSNFKVQVICHKIGGGSNPTCNLDWLPVNVTYTPFNYSLSINQSNGSVNQFHTAKANISISLVSGTSQAVSLSISGCPSGTSCSLSPSSGSASYSSIFSALPLTTPVGNYVISITSSGNGIVQQVNYTLTVADSQPVASISANATSGYAPLTVNLTGIVSGGESPFIYSWNFTDGTNSSLQNPVHTFSSNGTYNISFTVTDNDGDSSTNHIVITADPVPVCVPANPQVFLIPSWKNASAGSTNVYLTQVKNVDTSPCGNTTYSMSASIPQNWSSSFASNFFTLNPGQSHFFNFSLTSASNATLGTYGFSVSAHSLLNSSLIGTTYGNYTVI